MSSSDMHSSNAAIVPNSAWNLILADGRLYEGSMGKIPGFYKKLRPLTEIEKMIL
ncbi:hypothetical protein OXIME_000120 [Oxyplasma meridianum]|uniref:Uncharacterized protein n=1 Tax=Oxyplasma meridianum TaxID=3073602 RepID=A0AAX4NFS1_9ARCH